MLSSLPKLADRSFVLGALLPSLLFGVSLLFLFRDQAPVSLIIGEFGDKDIGKTVYLLLAAWGVAVLILMLNLPLYRFLEGYTFPKWLARPLQQRHQKRLRVARGEIKSLYDLWAEKGTKFPFDKLERYQTARQDLVKWMPSQEEDVLPTRFGNAIKAFEVYPRDIYGADGIVIWLRLVSVLPSSFLELIQGVRSQIDFLVNCCFFSVVISLLGAVRVIYSADWHNLHLRTGSGFITFISSTETSWFFWIAGGLVAAYLFYQWAAYRIPAWGELVMSAFDCYLPALAAQFGFELPKTEAERRTFWTTFSQQLIYRREPDGRLPFSVEVWKQKVSKSPISEPGSKRGTSSATKEMPTTIPNQPPVAPRSAQGARRISMGIRPLA